MTDTTTIQHPHKIAFRARAEYAPPWGESDYAAARQCLDGVGARVRALGYSGPLEVSERLGGDGLRLDVEVDVYRAWLATLSADDAPLAPRLL